MSRWHTLSCKTPDVFLKGASPYCRECEASFSQDVALRVQTPASAPPQKRHWGRWVDNTFRYKLSGWKVVKRPARFRFGRGPFPLSLSAVHVRAPMSVVWKVMKAWFSCLANIHRILGCSVAELESLVRHGSREEGHHLIGTVPGDFGDFAGDGRTYQVQII
ncbi:hypothetical protein BJY04DRAFT_187748 [Aspergillus karnatakaensis]|uniref:uncharacterized protein n=1 Tax=Aspergillus karnatakaensis TaxID=1810916 RepID=UPI003CCCA4B0